MVHQTLVFLFLAAAPPADDSLDTSLRAVLRQGALIYNDGDHAGCCRFFEGALTALRPLLAGRPDLQAKIDRGIEDARAVTGVADRAFRLREVTDALRQATTPQPPPAKTDATFKVSKLEQEILDRTNAERKAAGLDPLVPDEKLFKSAREHAANMAKQKTMSHTLDEKGPGERLADVGYDHFGWAENVASGQRSAEELVKSWMESPGHKANILSDNTQIGIGAATDADGTPYYVQVFAKPRKGLP